MGNGERRSKRDSTRSKSLSSREKQKKDEWFEKRMKLLKQEDEKYNNISDDHGDRKMKQRKKDNETQTSFSADQDDYDDTTTPRRYGLRRCRDLRPSTNLPFKSKSNKFKNNKRMDKVDGGGGGVESIFPASKSEFTDKFVVHEQPEKVKIHRQPSTLKTSGDRYLTSLHRIYYVAFSAKRVRKIQPASDNLVVKRETIIEDNQQKR